MAVSGQIDGALSAAELIKLIYQRTVPLFISVEWISYEFLKIWLLRSVIAGIAVLFLVKIVRRRKPEDITLFAMTAVISAFFLVTLGIVGTQGLQHRHMSILILPLALIPFAALARVQNKKLIFAWAAFVIFLNIGSYYFAYRPMAKPGDFIHVADYLMINEEANQPILVFHSDAKLPLSYYYHGQNHLIAVPQENQMDVWNPRNNILRDETQILELIDNQPNRPQRFWLVNDGWCAHGSISFNCQILDEVVTKYFEIESKKTFFEVTSVQLLRRK